jgi:hypothetical protein
MGPKKDGTGWVIGSGREWEGGTVEARDLAASIIGALGAELG